MGISVHKGFFNGLGEAIEDIRSTGFWPTTLVSEPSPTPHVHWHDSMVHGYVMKGETWIIDGETGDRFTLKVGDKLVIPAGALHAEGEPEHAVTYLVALPEPRPFAEVFQLRAADDPNRPT